MSERQVTMAMCAHCDQPVQPSLHTTVQCLDNMRAQRDEARHVARCYHAYGKSETLEGQYPWLKEQASVDE